MIKDMLKMIKQYFLHSVAHVKLLAMINMCNSVKEWLKFKCVVIK